MNKKKQNSTKRGPPVGKTDFTPTSDAAQQPQQQKVNTSAQQSENYQPRIQTANSSANASGWDFLQHQNQAASSSDLGVGAPKAGKPQNAKPVKKTDTFSQFQQKNEHVKEFRPSSGQQQTSAHAEVGVKAQNPWQQFKPKNNNFEKDDGADLGPKNKKYPPPKQTFNSNNQGNEHGHGGKTFNEAGNVGFKPAHEAGSDNPERANASWRKNQHMEGASYKNGAHDSKAVTNQKGGFRQQAQAYPVQEDGKRKKYTGSDKSALAAAKTPQAESTQERSQPKQKDAGFVTIKQDVTTGTHLTGAFQVAPSGMVPPNASTNQQLKNAAQVAPLFNPSKPVTKVDAGLKPTANPGAVSRDTLAQADNKMLSASKPVVILGTNPIAVPQNGLPQPAPATDETPPDAPKVVYSDNIFAKKPSAVLRPEKINANTNASAFAKKPVQSVHTPANNPGRAGTSSSRKPMKELQLITNQFQLIFRNKYQIHNYGMKLIFVPPPPKPDSADSWFPSQSVLDRKIREVVIKLDKQLKLTFVNYIWSGKNLFSMSVIENDEDLVYRCEIGQNEVYNLVIQKVGSFNLEGIEQQNMDQSPFQITFINILIQQMMRSGSLKQVGRLPRFFRETDKLTIHDEFLGQLELWPGFKASSYIYNSGIFVVLESINKFLRRENCLDKIKEMHWKQKCSPKILDEFFQDRQIMTEWGARRMYKISRVRLDMSPLKANFSSEGNTISVKDYFKEKYGIELEANQPLLEVGSRKNAILLPPQLCTFESMPELLKKNKTLVSKYRKDPTEKLDSVKGVINEICQNSEMQEWGIELDPQPYSFNARVLNKPMLITGTSDKDIRAIVDKNSYSNQILQPVSLRHEQWVLIYDADDTKYASLLFENLHVASEKLGTSVEEPYWIELPPRSYPKTYEQAIQAQISPQTCAAVVVLLPHFKYYSQVKRALDRQGVISQIVLKQNLRKAEFKESFAYQLASALLRQLNAKAGGDLYHLTLPKLPFKQTMLVGIDVCHFGPKSIVGFCATLNDQFSKYYSQVYYQTKGKEIGDTENMKLCYQNAIEEYHRVNPERVEHIIIFRDGVGDSMREQVVSEEIMILKELVREKFKLSPPKITLVIVNKRINQRFFEQTAAKTQSPSSDLVSVRNPPCGTIVDCNMVCNAQGDKLYDFFLVSQTATQGCILPTHFFVSYDNSGILQDVLQELTYSLCYFYFNWSGSIKVPAPCQYAHKVCKYALDINAKPSSNSNLYFL